MAVLNLRGVPDELKARLKKAAVDNGRTLFEECVARLDAESRIRIEMDPNFLDLPQPSIKAEPGNGRRREGNRGEGHQQERDLESGDQGGGKNSGRLMARGNRISKTSRVYERRDSEAAQATADKVTIATEAVAAIGERVVAAAELPGLKVPERKCSKCGNQMQYRAWMQTPDFWCFGCRHGETV